MNVTNHNLLSKKEWKKKEKQYFRKPKQMKKLQLE